MAKTQLEILLKTILDNTGSKALSAELMKGAQSEIEIRKHIANETNKISKQQETEFKRRNKAEYDDILKTEKLLKAQQDKQARTDSKLTGQTSQLGSLNSLQAQRSYLLSQSAAGGLNPAQIEANRNKILELNKAINQTKVELTGTGIAGKRSFDQLLERGENLTVVIAGIITAFSGIKNLVSDMITMGTTADVLKSHFKGTADELNDLSKSVKGTVDDSDLIKLSNQARDLGLSMKEQSSFFKLSKLAAEEYGGSVEENFSKVVMATEGNVRGLRALGIQKAEFNDKVQAMAKALNLETEEMSGENGVREITIKNVDAETKKRIYINAILDLSKDKLAGFNSEQLTSKDRMDKFNVAIVEAKEKIGSFIADGLFKITDAFTKSGDAALGTAGMIGLVGSTAVSAIPLIGSLRLALDGLTLSSMAVAGKLGAVVAITVGIIESLKWIDSQMGTSDVIGDYEKQKWDDYHKENPLQQTPSNWMPIGLKLPKTDPLDTIKKKIDVPGSKSGSKGGRGGTTPVTKEDITEIEALETALKKLTEGTWNYFLALQKINELKLAERFGNMSKEDMMKVNPEFGTVDENGRNKALKEWEKENALYNVLKPKAKGSEVDLKSAYGDISNIMNILNTGTDNFVSNLLKGFDQTLSVVDSLVNLFNSLTGSSIGGVFGLIGTVFGLSPGAGMAHTINGVVNSSSGGGYGRTGSNVHIMDVKIKGSDIMLSQNRESKTVNRLNG